MEYSERQEHYNKFKSIAYYLIIALISVLATTFLPMAGSQIGLDWNLPDTTVGWVVWGVGKASVAIVNIVMFYCFMEQAKVNVKDNEDYKTAAKILQRIDKSKELMPMSPKKWNAQQYGSKGTTIFLGSIASAIGLTQAVLSFDLMCFLSYLFTCIMGVVFGYLQMRKAEDYWTTEYPAYAAMKQKEFEEAEAKRKKEEEEAAKKKQEEEERNVAALQEADFQVAAAEAQYELSEAR